MLRKQVTICFGGLLLFGLLAYGIVHLLALRLERGDVYPPYSTLRADPLGAKAFYDALGTIGRLEVSRNYRELPKLQPPKPVTLVYVGADHRAEWGEKELEVFDSLVAAGSRAVIAFEPADRPSKSASVDEGTVDGDKKDEEKTGPREAETKPEAEDSKESGPEKEPKEHKEPRPKRRSISFREALKSWGCAYSYVKLERQRAFSGEATLNDASSKLEATLTWHSAIYFSHLAPEWRALYSCGGKPVIIERGWGAGSIVLASDAYFLSNEALRVERAPHLLASLVGPPNVVFDEAQHGVIEEMNLAQLARKYGLQGAVASLVLVAGLFIWRNVVRFVPPYDDRSKNDEIAGGQDAASGFVNLLRRSIPPAKLLETCANEWRKTAAANSPEAAKFEAALQAVDQSDPVAAYTSISERLKRPSTPMHHQSETRTTP